MFLEGDTHTTWCPINDVTWERDTHTYTPCIALSKIFLERDTHRKFLIKDIPWERHTPQVPYQRYSLRETHTASSLSKIFLERDTHRKFLIKDIPWERHTPQVALYKNVPWEKTHFLFCPDSWNSAGSMWSVEWERKGWRLGGGGGGEGWRFHFCSSGYSDTAVLFIWPMIFMGIIQTDPLSWCYCIAASWVIILLSLWTAFLYQHVLSRWTFCLKDVLSLWTFCPKDVLSLDVWSQDVWSQDVLSMYRYPG